MVMAVTVVAIGMAPAHAGPSDSGGPAPSPTAKVDNALRERVADGHQVRVNVTTRTRADLPEAAQAGEVVHRLRTLPVVTMRVDEADLDRLAAQPGVVSVAEDRPERATLVESVPLVGGDKTRAAGLTGAPLDSLLHLPTSLMTWWLAGVARWAAGLRPGEIVVLLVVALGAWSLGSGRWSWRWDRTASTSPPGPS